jgi:hypothetical protein
MVVQEMTQDKSQDRSYPNHHPTELQLWKTSLELSGLEQLTKQTGTSTTQQTVGFFKVSLQTLVGTYSTSVLVSCCYDGPAHFGQHGPAHQAPFSSRRKDLKVKDRETFRDTGLYWF